MSKSYAEISGAELLRADTCSQKIIIREHDSQASRNLISDNQFWGDDSLENKLLFEYTDDGNEGWAVERNGWNDFDEDKTLHMGPAETNTWIKNKMFPLHKSSFTVIQGYAGCGKTVFIHSLLRKYGSGAVNPCKNVYVDYDSDSSEGGYLTSAIRNWVIDQIIDLLSKKDGIQVYNKFVSLMNAYGSNNASFSNLIVLFRREGQIDSIVREMSENSSNPERYADIAEEFRVQFICGTTALSGALKSQKISSEIHTAERLIEIKQVYLNLLMEYYLAMTLLLAYAANAVADKSESIVLFDNLDIIDNPQHIAVFINSLHLVINRITSCFERKKDLRPVFHVIVAVRKVTYVLMGQFREVTVAERGDDLIPVNFLDISNLYNTTKLLKHKARILLNGFDGFIPEQYHRQDVKQFLQQLVEIPDYAFDDIGLPGLFNHNIRACANIMERAISHNTSIPDKGVIGNRGSRVKNSALWIHSICAVLQNVGVWRNMGYNDFNRDYYYFPTTLSRLILAYLFNQRRSYRRDAENYATTEVSFREIVQTFERFPFVEGYQVSPGIVEAAANDYSVEESRKKIINALSNMLKRNTKLDRINPNDEIELWRRPIYFTTNAFSLVDDMGNDNTYNELSQQISQFSTPNARITNFCLTDEGYTFIDKIATHFEFYSVRYNGNDAVPLCNLTDVKDIDKMVERVFKKVERCVKNQKWLISFYIRQYGNLTFDPKSPVLDPHSDSFGKNSPDFKKCLNQYLGEKFHPRTESNRPQMHIVRTIYDHIRYLNDLRDSLILENVPNLLELNICILRWIGEYLQLYRTNLYDLLDGTIGSFNEVYLDLKYIYWRIYTDTSSNHLPLDDSKKRHLSIFRADTLREGSATRISDGELLNNPMLDRYKKNEEKSAN